MTSFDFCTDHLHCNSTTVSKQSPSHLSDQDLPVTIVDPLHLGKFCFFLQPKCNSMTRAIVGTTVGTKATIVPLVAAAFPFVARLVESSLREVDGNIIEAAQSMGATPLQIITKVMIPECLPGLISSMTTALTTILGYSAMSGIIGGGGLGKIAIDYGYYRYKYLVMLVAVVILILLVQLFQSVGTWLSKRCDKRLKH